MLVSVGTSCNKLFVWRIFLKNSELENNTFVRGIIVELFLPAIFGPEMCWLRGVFSDTGLCFSDLLYEKK